MCRGNSRWVFLGVFVLALAAATPQLQAQISLADPGWLWTGTSDPNPNPAVNSPLALTCGTTNSVLVVEINERNTANAADLPSGPNLATDLTFGGQALILATSSVAAYANYNSTGIYYLPNPPTSGSLSVSFPLASTSNYAIDAFTLTDVNTSINPIVSATAAVVPPNTDNGQTSQPLTVTINVVGSCAVDSSCFRDGTGNVVATISGAAAGASAQLVTTSSGGNSSNGHLWQYNDGTIFSSGALATGLSSGSLTLTESNLNGPANSRWTDALAVFTPVPPALAWTGAAGSSGTANWNTSDANWSGTSTTYSDGTGAVLQFPDSGSNTNIAISAAGVSPGSMTFTNSSTVYSFSGGAINGTGGITLSGGGLVQLSNTNSYSGATTISAGTLQIASANSLGSGGTLTIGNGNLQVLASAPAGAIASPVVLSGNGAIQVDSSGPIALTGAVTGNSPLTKKGSGTLALQNAGNSYSGGTVINAGKVIAYGAGSLGTGPVTLNNGGALTLCTAANAVVTSGFGGNGTGWNLNGSANWSSATNPPTVSNNVLTLTAYQNWAQTSSAFYNTPIAGIAAGFTASFVYTPTGTSEGATFTIQASGPTACGLANGDLGYTCSGWPLTGIPNSGAVALNLDSSVAGGIGTSFCWNNGSATYNSTNDNNPAGDGNFPGTAYQSVGPVSLASGDPIQVNLTYSAVAQTLTEVLTDTTNNNTSTTTFSGVNFSALLGSTSGYVGFTGGSGNPTTQTISNFSLAVGSNFPSSYTNGVVVAAQASSSLNIAPGVGALNATIGPLTMGSGATLNVAADGGWGGAYTITTGSTGVTAAATFNVASLGTLNLGALSDGGSPASITLAGSGTLVLTASATSLVNGTQFNVTGGSLLVGDATGLGAGTLAAVNVAATAAFGIPGGNTTIAALSGAGTVLPSGNQLTVGSGNNLSSTFSGAILGSGSLVKAGLGTLALTGTNSSYTGNTTISAGTLQIASLNSLGSGGTLTIGNGNLQVLAAAPSGAIASPVVLTGSGAIQVDSSGPITLSGAVTGNSPLTKNGGGTLALQNWAGNSYSGGTVINAGKVIAYGGGALGSGPVTINNGGALTLSTASNPVVLAGFGSNGTGWQFNDTNNGWAAASPPTASNNVLSLTNSGYIYQANSAFYNTPIAGLAGGFAASFVYTPNGTSNGATFTIQASGPTACGIANGDLGYTCGGWPTIGIPHSMAVALNLDSTANGGIGTSFCWNNGSGSYNNPAADQNFAGTAYQSVSPVSLASGDPIQVNLTYSAVAQTLTEVLTDTTNNNTSTTTFTGVNFSALLGSTSGYVGFTGGTTNPTTQTISNFSLAVGSIIPATYANNMIVNGGTLDVTSGSSTVQSLTIGSLGSLDLTIGDILTSTGSASLGGTLNLAGSYASLPAVLMNYPGFATGTFSNVTLNGTSLVPADLSYLNGNLELTGTAAATITVIYWTSATSGNWSLDANWSGTHPNAIGFSAVFSGSASNTPLTVTLDAPQTVGTLVFGNTGSAGTSYTLTGSTLTLNNSTSGGISMVTVLNGSHTISAPLQIAGGSLIVNASGSGNLNISGNISDDNGAESLTLAGDGTGTLILSGTNNTYGGGTTVEAGTLIVNNGGAIPADTNLSVGAGGTFIFDPSISTAGSSLPASSHDMVTAVPEPGTLSLLLAGALLLMFHRKRRRENRGLAMH